MTISFVVEDGSGLANATSYVSVAEADDLAGLNIHNSADWLALSLSTKQSLLSYVSRVLDSRTMWDGTQVSSTQALAWPRSDVTDKYGNVLASNAIPLAVRWAVVELAKHTMAEDLLAKVGPDQIVREIKIDSISVAFGNYTDVAMAKYKTPAIVTDILKGIGRVRNGTGKVTFGLMKRR